MHYHQKKGEREEYMCEYKQGINFSAGHLNYRVASLLIGHSIFVCISTTLYMQLSKKQEKVKICIIFASLSEHCTKFANVELDKRKGKGYGRVRGRDQNFVKLKGVSEENVRVGESKLHCNLTIEVLLINEYLTKVAL